MIFKKIAAGVFAFALAVSTMAMSANAMIYPIPDDVRDPSLATDENWLIQLYNTGNPAENKPQVDRGLDLQAINSFTYYMELLPNPDPEWGLSLEAYDVTFDGFGGNIIYSANGGTIGNSDTDSDWYDEENGITLHRKYNWAQDNSWWGLPEEGDTPEGQGVSNQGTVDYVDQNTALEYVNKFAYKLELDIARDHADDPDYVWPEGGTCYQVGVQEWGKDYTYGLKIDVLILRDIDGNFMMAFDENGTEITEEKANEIIEYLETREYVPDTGEDEEPDESESSSTEATTTTDNNNNGNSGNNNVPVIIGIIAAVVVVVVVVIVVIVVVSKKKKS